MRFFATKGTSDGSFRGSLPRELTIFLLAVVLLWAITLIDTFHLLSAINLYRFGLMYGSPQGDILCCAENFHALHTSSFFMNGYVWNYPAPCALIYRFFYLFQTPGQSSAGVVAAYLSVVGLLTVASAAMLQDALHRRGLARWLAIPFVAAVAILSWPIFYSVERGNIEGLLWLGLALGVVFYVRRQWMLAAIVIGIFAAFKMYPILFFGLFLGPRRYRELAAGLTSALLTTIGSLLYLGPTLGGAAWYTLRGIHYFIKSSSSQYHAGGLSVDHSAFILVKMLSASHPQSVPSYLPRYELAAGIIALLIFFGRTWKMPRPNQVLMLSVSMVLLPATSYDYTLQSLYIPWAWLCLLIVSAHRAGKRIPGAIPAMLCFAILFAPETFLQFDYLSFAGPLKALTLIALIGVSMIYPFAEETPREFVEAARLGNELRDTRRAHNPPVSPERLSALRRMPTDFPGRS